MCLGPNVNFFFHKKHFLLWYERKPHRSWSYLKMGNSRVKSKKNLISKPKFKQHHFQCLHNLAPSFVGGNFTENCRLSNHSRRDGERVKQVPTNFSWEKQGLDFSGRKHKSISWLKFYEGCPWLFQIMHTSCIERRKVLWAEQSCIPGIRKNYL